MAIDRTQSFAQARKAIKDEIINILKLEQNNTLSDVKSVQYGNRSLNVNHLPAIFVLPGSHSPQPETQNSTLHSFVFDFTVFVQNSDPEIGLDTAEDISARIKDLFVKDADKALLNGLVEYSQVVRIDPSYQVQAGKTIFAANIYFQFDLTLYDRY